MYHFSTSQNKDRPCGSVSRRTRRKPRGTRVESGGAPPRCGRKNATRGAQIGCCRVPSCATGRTAERGHAIAFRAVAGCVACCRLAFGAHLAGNSCWPLGLNCLGIYTGNLYASVVRHPLVHPVTFLSIRGTSSLAGNADTKVWRMSLVRRCPGWELGSVRYRSEAAALWSIT